MADPFKIGDWVVPKHIPNSPKSEILICLGRTDTNWNEPIYAYLIEPEINGLSIWCNTQLEKADGQDSH